MGVNQENMVIHGELTKKTWLFFVEIDQQNMVILWELTQKRGVFMGVGVDQETLCFYWTAVTRLLILVGLHQHEWWMEYERNINDLF